VESADCLPLPRRPESGCSLLSGLEGRPVLAAAAGPQQAHQRQFSLKAGALVCCRCYRPSTTVRVCDLPGKSSGSCWRCLELCLVVVPSSACLVAPPSDAPAAAEGPARGCCEQPACSGWSTPPGSSRPAPPKTRDASKRAPQRAAEAPAACVPEVPAGQRTAEPNAAEPVPATR
jgi:hypothetical protein